MLKAHQRLRHSFDIGNAYKYGKRVVAPHGVFFVFKKTQRNNTLRCAVVIGKKYSLSAVVRNKQRRIIQSGLATMYPYIGSGYDVVIGYTKKGKVVSYKEALEDIRYFYQKLDQ